MATFTVKEASAASAVGTNLMAGHREQMRNAYRVVKRLGLVGSTNPGDAAVQLFYGNTFIGEFFNTSGGANLIPLEAKDLVTVSSDVACEPGEPLNVIISDAGAGNVIVVTLDVEEL